MSLMMVSSASALERVASTYSRCSSVNSVSNNREIIPITPFIGVRISWLMFARNADFARRRIGPELAHEGEAIDAGHHQILQNYRGFDLGRHRDRFAGIRAIMKINVHF